MPLFGLSPRDSIFAALAWRRNRNGQNSAALTRAEKIEKGEPQKGIADTLDETRRTVFEERVFLVCFLGRLRSCRCCVAGGSSERFGVSVWGWIRARAAAWAAQGGFPPRGSRCPRGSWWGGKKGKGGKLKIPYITR